MSDKITTTDRFLLFWGGWPSQWAKVPFVVDGVPTETQEDLDFFTFPALDQTIGSDALDAPIDGFCVSANAENEDAAKAFISYLGTAEASDGKTDPPSDGPAQ